MRRVLDRRHLDMIRKGWTPLLLLEATIILAGCAVCNHWELNLKFERAWIAILLTKAVQALVMLLLALWLRPPPEGGQERAGRDGALGRPEPRPSGEIWSAGAGLLWKFPGADGDQPSCCHSPYRWPRCWRCSAVWGSRPWGPPSGAGATCGERRSCCSPFFISALAGPYNGMTVLGVGWFVCLVVGSVHLYCSR